jgi:hypothetical protein
MNKIIVYLNDAEHAGRHLLRPDGEVAPRGATHWILVACPPRMTRHIGKWVSHRSREQWRAKWAQRHFDMLAPALQGRGDRLTTVLASSPLTEVTRELLSKEGAAQVLDLRRPRFGPGADSPGSALPDTARSPWLVPGATAGVGAAMLLMAGE